MAAPGGGSKLSYTPAPYEQAYHEGLFAAADTQRTGNIGGAQAVQFFSRSKLPVDALKNIWTVADQPPTNALDRRKFAVAVRLIQLLQNGQKGQGPNLAAPPGVKLRPAMFEGVSGVAVPLPQEPVGGPPPPQPQQPPQLSPRQPMQPQQPPQQAMTPPRPPSAASVGHPTPTSTTALTAQDPYTLPPNEQSRYEQIFPQYARDGYVYGKEAVDLFSKSGMSQQHLAAIWNMVDTPVDNRLDKLEFAIAMHLIVCITKKNLPMPPALPVSLKQLKSQQPPTSPVAQAGPPASPVAQAGPPPSMPSPGALQMPSPAAFGQQGGAMSLSQQGGPPPIQRTPTTDSGFGSQVVPPQMTLQPPQTITTQAQPQTVSAPSPSLQSTGGMSGGGGAMNISDAFEGLSMVDSGPSYMSQTPILQTGSTGGIPDPKPVALSESPKLTTASAASAFSMAAAPSPTPPPIVEPPKSTKQLASSYDMGDAHEELEKLKNTLQRLQAENISLKAQLGTLSEEEKDVQKELSATVGEIGSLSNNLTTLRAQVLASKSRLLEAASELKAAKEKKGVINDLIGEATETKRAMEEAGQGLENAIEAANAQPAPAPAPAAFEGDLFEFGPSAPQVSEQEPSHEPQPQRIEQQKSEESAEDVTPGYYSDTPSYGQNQAPQPAATNEMYGTTAATHNRTASALSAFSFEGDGPMGGTPSYGGPPGPSYAFSSGSADVNTGAESYEEYGASLAASPSLKEVEELKAKAKEADQIARDAEESRRQMSAQVDELRRVADAAEAEARKHASAGEVKKKHFMGRGKRREAKENEKLAQDAKAKKDQLMQAQSQANDAQALAVETRQEADRLRREAEDAEMKAAAAASRDHAQPTNNGYSTSLAPPSYGMPQQNKPSLPESSAISGSQIDQPSAQPPAMGGGFDGQPFGGYTPGGYDPNVMGGGGGLEIPTPAGNDDPYSNPFE